MGKGSTARPLSIPREQFGDRFEGIFGTRKRVQWVPPTAGCLKCPRDPAKVCGYCGIDLSDDGPKGGNGE